MSLKFIILFISLTLTSCSLISKKKVEPKKPTSTEEAQLQFYFQKGMKELDEEDYEGAIKSFTKILVDKPSSQLDLITLYNLGVAQESLGRCRMAVKRYRQVVRIASEQYKKLEAQTLYRLSHAYECLGQNVKSVASLVDAYNRRSFLFNELALAEVPARLASAYARSGDLKAAEKFFKIAEDGVNKLKKNFAAKNRKKLLARTLYYMGQMKQDLNRSDKRAQFYLSSMRYMQAYLLKSVEMGAPVWSVKSANEIIKTYRNLWIRIQRLSKAAKNTESVKSRKLRTNADDLSLEAVKLITELEDQRFPDGRENTTVIQLFLELSEAKKRFSRYLASQNIELPLSEKALETQGLKMKGKINSKPTILEREALRRERMPDKGN